MKDLNYRQPDGKKPWYKRWKVWGYPFAALVLLGIILDVSGWTDANEAEKAEETAARVQAVEAELAASAEARAKADAKKAAEKPKVTTADVKSESAEVTTAGRVAEIRKVAVKFIEKYDGSETVKIDVNENMGANDGSYIVLAYMSFPRKNSAKMSREMIEMYSSDLAANLAKESDVSAVTVFWEVPRFVASGNAAKYAYERIGSGMVLDDEVVAVELQK